MSRKKPGQYSVEDETPKDTVDPEIEDPNYGQNNRDENSEERKRHKYGVFYEKAPWNTWSKGKMYIDANGTRMWKYRNFMREPVDYDNRNFMYMNKKLEKEAYEKTRQRNRFAGKRTRKHRKYRR